MVWGKLGTINVYGCNPKKIRDKREIKRFVGVLCEFIDMERKGSCRVKRFGKGDLKGYSAIQFIEYSSITIHFDEVENRAFIDVFSCKDFDTSKVEGFSRKFFNGERSSSKTMLRK